MYNIIFRFNVVEWGSVDREMGLIAGGGDNGIISLWDPAKILRFAICGLWLMPVVNASILNNVL